MTSIYHLPAISQFPSNDMGPAQVVCTMKNIIITVYTQDAGTLISATVGLSPHLHVFSLSYLPADTGTESLGPQSIPPDRIPSPGPEFRPSRY